MFKYYFVCIFLIFNCFCLEKATIAFVFDGEEAKTDPFVTKIEQEIHSLLEDEFEVEIRKFYGNWTLRGARQTLNDAFNSESDVVIALGFLTSLQGLEIKDLPKPLVVSYDIDLLESEDKDRVYSNKLAYHRGQKTFFSQIEQFLKIAQVNKVGVISDPTLLENSEIRQMLEKTITRQGRKVVFYPVTEHLEGLNKQINTDKVDGVIFLPTYRVDQDEFDHFVKNLRVPSFSFIGESEVDRGILMSMTSETEKLRLSRRIALNVQEMLLTQDNKEIVVDFFRTSEVVINDRTRQKLGMDFSWSFLADAKIIDEVPIPTSKILSIQQTITIALEKNLNLNAEKAIVKSGQELVNLTQAPLLPQVTTEAVNRVVDRNTALYARGTEPQSLLKAKLGVTQLLYDEELISNFEIQKYLQSSREYNQEKVELNTILFAAVIYVDVLRIDQERKIALENIALSKANLRRAHELVESGEKRKSEVYRWEAELSNSKDDLAEIQARLDNRKADFNRELNRPIITPVYLEDISIFDPELFHKIVKVMKHTQTPKEYENFKELLISVSRKRVPEIKVLEQEVLAQERKLKATKRAFVLPSVFAFAETQKFLAKQGAGSAPPPGVTNNSWSTSIGVTLSYPLITGGARLADRNKASYDLQTIRIRKNQVVQNTDTRVVKAIDQLKASYDQIFFSKAGKEAADKNLVIVTNSYSRGLVSIVDLLDAQNTAITSRLAYSNAVYDFIIDYLALQRAVGDFDQVFVDEEGDFTKAIMVFLGDGNEK